jgi:hypothetical protein
MCQTIKQHKRLVRGNRKMHRMAITQHEVECLRHKRIGRVFWSSIALCYLVLGVIAYFAFVPYIGGILK